MTNYLGKQGASFVYDRTWDSEVLEPAAAGYRSPRWTRSRPSTPTRPSASPSRVHHTEKTGTVAGGAWTQLGAFPVTAARTSAS